MSKLELCKNMDKQEIQKLIEEAIKHKAETDSVEFKDARGGLPKSTWKSISAFSHRPGGGIIVFGISEDKEKHEIKIMGTDMLDNLQEKIGDLVNNEMSFIIRPNYHILEIESKTILAVFIPECPDQFKPCYYKPAGMPNGAYIRDGNTDRKMTDDEMRSLIDNSKKFKFDITIAEETSLEDLSKDKILELLIKSGERTKRRSSIEEINFELPTIETEEVIDKPIIQVPDVLEERFETIGAAISSHLRERSMYAAVAVVLAIILYIGYTFRKVSKPVQSWKYGVTAIIALFHDVIITMAVFAVLGHYAGVEVGISFVVALLTIMGYSVNDTIVVFDRIRENLIKRGSDQFDETVNMGVKQSITRSLNTSLTTLLVLVALFVFGGESIHYFSLTLIVGIVVGTYSSIFLASPLLVEWANYKKR